jgi:hypothetical protein
MVEVLEQHIELERILAAAPGSWYAISAYCIQYFQALKFQSSYTYSSIQSTVYQFIKGYIPSHKLIKSGDIYDNIIYLQDGFLYYNIDPAGQ